MTPDTKEAFDSLLKCTDGPGLLVLRTMVEELDAQADEYSKEGLAAGKVINIVRQFGKLCALANDPKQIQSVREVN